MTASHAHGCLLTTLASQQIIDRQKEQASFQLLEQYHLAPPVFGVFSNGFACGYFPGNAIGPDLVSHHDVYPKIARRCDAIEFCMKRQSIIQKCCWVVQVDKYCLIIQLLH